MLPRLLVRLAIVRCERPHRLPNGRRPTLSHTRGHPRGLSGTTRSPVRSSQAVFRQPMPDTPDSTDAPTPPPSGDADRHDHAGGFTINLASGKAPGTRPRRNKKSAAPKAVVQKTINLSTPKPEGEKQPEASAQKPKRGGGKDTKGRGGPKGKQKGPRPSSGTSLADLLDPEVLAKLKGG